jgi:microcystin-dependent protein
MIKRPKFRTKLDSELPKFIKYKEIVQDNNSENNNLVKIYDVGSIHILSEESIPDGWLFCDGSEISRSEYSNLFSTIGTSFGEGDGSTTFNIPDLSFKPNKNKSNVKTVAGSGVVYLNSATFTNHKITKNGFKVRIKSGNIYGLNYDVDYFVIVIDPNTLSFATTLSNSLAGIKISISGSNSAILNVWEDESIFLNESSKNFNESSVRNKAPLLKRIENNYNYPDSFKNILTNIDNSNESLNKEKNNYGLFESMENIKVSNDLSKCIYIIKF